MKSTPGPTARRSALDSAAASITWPRPARRWWSCPSSPRRIKRRIAVTFPLYRALYACRPPGGAAARGAANTLQGGDTMARKERALLFLKIAAAGVLLLLALAPLAPAGQG